MKRALRYLLIVLGILVVAAVALPLLIDANQFRPLLESKLSAALGRETHVGDLKLALLSGKVTAADLSIADDPAFSKESFVRAKSLGLAVELWPLLTSHKLNVTGITIDQPQIALIQSEAGEWNFSRMGAPAAAKPAAAAPASNGKDSLDLSVKLIKISDGRFSVLKQGGRARPVVLENLNAELRDFSSATEFPFSLSAKIAGGGSMQMDGKAGPIDQGDVSMTPAQVSLKVDKLDLAASDVTAQSPALAGLITVDATLQTKGGRAGLQGKLKAERLVLAKSGTPASQPVEFDFTLDHEQRARAGRLSRGDLHIGKAGASLTGTYAHQDEATVLNMILSGPGMPVAELTGMLPAMAVALPAGSSLQGGTASARFTLSGPTDRLVTNGSVSLDKTRLHGFDLGKKMSAIETLAGIQPSPDTDIEKLSANLRTGPEGTNADALKLVVPSIGELSGGGSISNQNALDLKMSALLHTTGMLAAVGEKSIPFLVTGTCTDPIFRPDMKAVAAQEVQNLKGSATKAAGGFLKGLIGGKKKQ